MPGPRSIDKLVDEDSFESWDDDYEGGSSKPYRWDDDLEPPPGWGDDEEEEEEEED